MEDRLQQFLDGVFAPYGDFPAKADVTKELLANLQERYRDYKTQGKSDQEAYQATIDSFGDVGEIMDHVPHKQPDELASEESRKEPSVHKLVKEAVRTARSSRSKFSYTNLTQTDLADSDLRDADFSCSAL